MDSKQTVTVDEALADSEQWFRFMADAIPQIVWSCSAEGDCDYLNKRWSEYTGVPSEEGLGSGWFDRVHPEDREHLLKAWLSAVEQRSLFDVEYRLAGAGGMYRWFKGHAVPIVDGDGHFIRWLGTNTDIHEAKVAHDVLEKVVTERDSEIAARKLLEEQIRESESKMRAVLDSAIDAYMVMDAGGAIIDWNQEAERCFGWARQEALGRSLAETIVPERFRKAHERGIQAILADRQGQMVNRKFELTALRRDGHEFPVEMKLLAVKQESGYFFAAFVSDITNKKLAEETAHKRSCQLQEAQTRLQAILSSMQEGLCQLDNDGLCVYLNPAGEKILGYSFEEVRGKAMPAPMAMPGGQGDHLPDAGQGSDAVASCRVPNAVVETSVVRKDRSLVPVQLSIAPLLQGEKQAGMVVVFRDVSDQIKMREERESFLALLAHDLKTPLIAAVQVLGALLQGKRGALSKRHAEILEMVKLSNAEMLQMVQEVLEVYRYSGERNFLHKEEIDLMELLQECINRLASALKEKNATVKLNCLESMLQLHADRKAVRHLFMNLLGNAIKFTSPKSCIELSANKGEKQIAVQVKDCGEGIAPEDMQKLFQPFWQGASGKRRTGGSGLGLYLCRQIVDAHGGKIDCTSAPGGGTTFSIELPV